MNFCMCEVIIVLLGKFEKHEVIRYSFTKLKNMVIL